jgi:hypothetical protein
MREKKMRSISPAADDRDARVRSSPDSEFSFSSSCLPFATLEDGRGSVKDVQPGYDEREDNAPPAHRDWMILSIDDQRGSLIRALIFTRLAVSRGSRCKRDNRE